jgi:hypothetical protein
VGAPFVITGMGVVSAIGCTVKRFWETFTPVNPPRPNRNSHPQALSDVTVLLEQPLVRQ